MKKNVGRPRQRVYGRALHHARHVETEDRSPRDDQPPGRTHIAAGAALGNIPLVDRLDQNPLEVIRTGDWVRIDADKGIVAVTRKEES
jgi:hypothetical protein